ncbi:MAG: GGDEF domain-containing phosphodiesterase, partial [Longicatena sp.]
TFFLRAKELIEQNPKEVFQVIAFDIEHFKLVNDYFGTQSGDALLSYVAKRLLAMFPFECCCISRITADNFMLLLPISEGGEIAVDKIQRICKEAPIDMDIIPAIGIYEVHEDIAMNRMCDRADMAAKSIKGNYSNHVAYYNDNMRNDLVEEQELLNGVESSLDHHEFEIYFQPKCNMYTGKITGAEALVRWNHPMKGLIAPNVFINLFERNGFIKKLDQFVWRETVRWIAKRMQEGHELLPISVNISRIDIIGMDVVGFFQELVNEFGIDPSWIELEITESAYSARSEEIIFVVDRLMRHGFTVLMDDFGSGYSSLNMLKDISVDVLKLDMRFLDNQDKKSKDILESVVHMAKWLNLKVIAEGVETRQQVDFLLGIGCTYAQGFYYYKPMPLNDFESLIQKEGIADYHDIDMVNKNEEILTFKDLLHEDSISELLLANILGAVVLYTYEDGCVQFMKANEKYHQMMGTIKNHHSDI